MSTTTPVSKGEVALLVLQFLKDEQCNTTYEVFQNESKHLLVGLDTVCKFVPNILTLVESFSQKFSFISE
jgi:hypothetical protein